MKEKYFTVAKTITQWKRDNWIENWLGQKADCSEFWKSLYVLYYRLIDSSYYKKGLPYIQTEIVRQTPNADGLGGVNLKRDMVYSLHRFGTSNAGAGGIYASVDIKEGIVNSIARDNAGNQHLRHPDSKVVIPGFCIPKWTDALSLVRKMALTVPGATVISWDLAYSNKGWLMVEGNDVGDPYLLQAPLQKPIKENLLSLIDDYYRK